jgi:uncharacterized zinc-type alcohol dehydrogenase-like protein
VKFAAAWGCEVTAFTSSEGKANETRAFGAHHVLSSRDSGQLAAIVRTLDLVIVTVNVPLDWKAMIATLRPRGRIHFVGAVLEPIPVAAMDLIMAQARHLRIAQRVADDDRENDDLRGPASCPAADRTFPDR